MRDLIINNYKIYTDFVNKEKMIHSVIDGLIPVHRRVLYSAYLKAKDFVKTFEVLSQVLKYHPFVLADGPVSTCVNNGFLDGSGNWGITHGFNREDSAAFRYTSVRLNPFIKEFAFKMINNVEFNTIHTTHKEPKFIPTPIPFVLFSKYESIMMAVGYKPIFPTYKLEDLINRLLFLLGKRDEIIIKPNIHTCEVLSSNETCNKLLTTGKAKIKLKGKYIFDEEDLSVIIDGWSPNYLFSSIYNNILKTIDENEDFIGHIDLTGGVNIEADIYVEPNPRIKIEVKKLRNKSDTFDKLKSSINKNLKFTHNYEIFVVDIDGNVRDKSVDDMLLTCYSYYKSTYDSYLRNLIQIEQCKLIESENITKLKPHISTTKNINELSKLSLLDKTIVTELCKKYTISELYTSKDKKSIIANRINDLTKKLDYLENSVIDIYNALLNGT